MNTIKIITKKDGGFALQLITTRGNVVAQTSCKKGEAAMTKAIARVKTNAGMMADQKCLIVYA